MAGSGCNAYQIRKIYAIGGALGMVKRNEEDDLLHELVEGMTGKKSIKALTYGEACKVIGELEGRQGTPPPRKSGKPLRKTAPGHTSEGQRRKVWALMYRLQDASPSKAQLGDRLCAIIKKELGILSPEDIQQLIKRPQMQGIGAVGNAGALFTCEKVFGYSQKNAEGWFKALKKKYPLYKGESGKIEDALAQRIAFAEELRRDGAKYGLVFSR